MRYSNIIFCILPSTLLLGTPFATDSGITNGTVSGKIFWVQLVLFIYSISLLAFTFKEKNFNFTFTRKDLLILLIGVWCAVTYSWDLNPEPLKLLFGGQMIVLWFLLRYTLSQYPTFNRYLLLILIGTGLIEAIWGIRQLHGWSDSNHSLFRLTGTFFNPGPYSGYLAVILPIALGVLLKQSVRNILYYFAAACIIAILVVLPAGMSRSAWIAAAGSCAWVYAMYRLDWERIKNRWKQHKMYYIAGGLSFCVAALVGLSYLYSLKKDSADGRFVMWKVTAQAIQEQPFRGVGLGGFPAAYAKAQAEYMTSGKATAQEKLVAGCPEYAFNEYLQIGLEQGLLGLVSFVVLLGSVFYTGVRNRKYASCGGIIALALFAFSSYPLQLPDFWVVLIFLGVISITPERSKSEDTQTISSFSDGVKKLFIAGIAIIGISLFWSHRKYYNAYQEWDKLQMYSKNKAYEAAMPGYEKWYPLLNHKPEFLFEAAQCLSQSGQFEKANEYLGRAALLSSDPMIHYIMAKNEQALGKYVKAEGYLLHAIDILPERIYPYYLLVNLYTESAYNQPIKLKAVIDSVLIKEPKVNSRAIKEMRENARKMLKNTK